MTSLPSIRGCPSCHASLRAERESCPHCGELLNLTLSLSWLGGKEEEIVIAAPEGDEDDR